MPREGARAGREGHEQGGLRARGDHSPNLLWFHSSHLLLRSDALLVSLPPGWVVQVLESLVSSCDSRGTTNLGEEQSFRKATGKLLHLLLERRAAFPRPQTGLPQWGPGEET